MRPSEAARAAPAEAGNGPQIDRLGGRLDRAIDHLSGISQRSLIVGVDIGSRGAIAVLALRASLPELLDVFDMPCLNDGPAGRRAVNPALFAEIIAKTHPSKAYIELVGARPGEGAVGAFAFGRSRGVVEGVLGALCVPATHISPVAWKRAVGLPAGRDGAKDAARSLAIARWPAHAARFAKVKDDGRAEAALIGLAGLMREARHV
jgi:crossover junction endodeoxyribonuclease RuvC